VIECFPEKIRSALRKKRAVSEARQESAEKFSDDAVNCMKLLNENGEGLTADEISLKLGWTVPRTAAALFELEVAAAVSSFSGRYSPK